MRELELNKTEKVKDKLLQKTNQCFFPNSTLPLHIIVRSNVRPPVSNYTNRRLRHFGSCPVHLPGPLLAGWLHLALGI